MAMRDRPSPRPVTCAPAWPRRQPITSSAKRLQQVRALGSRGPPASGYASAMPRDDTHLKRSRDALARLDGRDATRADIARLVVEPALRWLGYPLTDPKSVRRGVEVADLLPPADLICARPADGLVLIWVVTNDPPPSLLPIMLAVLQTGLRVEERGARSVVVTNGKDWVGAESDPTTKFVRTFSATLESAEPLFAHLSLPSTSLPTATPTAPTPRPPVSVGGAAAPAPTRPPPDLRPAAGVALSNPTKGSHPGDIGGAGGHAARRADNVDDSGRPYVQADETFSKPLEVRIRGRSHPVTYWLDVVRVAAKYYLQLRSTLPTGKILAGQTRTYFSRDPAQLSAEDYSEIQDGWYMGHELNASLARKIATTLLTRAGVRESDIDIPFELPPGPRPHRNRGSS